MQAISLLHVFLVVQSTYNLLKNALHAMVHGYPDGARWCHLLELSITLESRAIVSVLVNKMCTEMQKCSVRACNS